jgi:hypothetical protein
VQLGGRVLELRSHPLMSYRSISSWPPIWIWIDGSERQVTKGEVGILREVRKSNIPKYNALYLVMEYAGNQYMGCLLLEDPSFYSEIRQLLEAQCGNAIADIGSLDISHTL